MRALLVVDPQQDFMKNGSLEVKNGDQIVPVINELTKSDKFDLVVFTKDWHPVDHKSFASQHENRKIFETINLEGTDQVLWPDHCVQGTQGAEFHKDIDLNIPNLYIFKKGMNPNMDSYSGFYENDYETSTGLYEFLVEKNVEEVFIVGLALDYCVSYSALDSVSEGFDTTIIMDGVRAITEDLTSVLDTFKRNGIKTITLKEFNNN